MHAPGVGKYLFLKLKIAGESKVMKSIALNSHPRFLYGALRALGVLLLMVLFAASIVAQTATATLSGTVTDEKDAVIPGANITIVNNATGARRNTITNEDGYFTLPLLPPSQYTLTVQRDGFTIVQVPNVILNVGDQKAIQIGLKVGDVNATVEVRPDETLVNTSPAVATTVDRNFVQNMPLNGRSFQSLILLTPGVVPVASTGTTPGQFSVNGQRTNTNYFTVDGVSANTGVSSASAANYFSQQAGGALPGFTAVGTTASLVSVDALEEFKIQTSTYSAEFGRQPGGQVQLVTRSGGNQFHGSVFDYLRNDALDARNFFNPKPARKPALRQNQFGGTFSGPVFLPRFGEGGKPYWSGRNKTFFFFSYEGLRLLLPVVPSAGLVVPSLRLRHAAPATIQPFLNALPLPTGPETTFNGSPSGFAPFQTSWSNPSSMDAWSIRLDHSVNDKLTLFSRYGYTPSDSLTRNTSYLSRLNGVVAHAQTLTFGATSVFSLRLTNDFRINYTKNSSRSSSILDDFGGAIPVNLSDLTSSYSGSGVKQGEIDFSFSGRFVGIQLGDSTDSSQRQFNVVDNLSITKGKHRIKVGIDWRKLSPVFGPFAYYQRIQFNTQNAVLNGNPDFLSRNAQVRVRAIYDNLSLYAADTWKVSDRLTLDLGLRWELNPPPHVKDGVMPVMITGIQGGNVSNAVLAPAGTPFYKTFYGGFSPRVGGAYMLRSKAGRETVLRGGFGVYNDLGSGSALAGFSSFPFAASVTTRGTSFGQPPIPFPLPSNLIGPPPFPPVALPISQFVSLYTLNPNLKLPYTLQWSAAVQQSIGKDQTVTVSYVGSEARRQLTTLTLNNPNAFTFIRPNSNFGTLLFVDNGPTSNYHGLQMQYQRRLSHGLQLIANYTWSHAIDDVSNEVPGVGGSFIATSDRGNADFDVRHIFSIAATYNLPKLRGSGTLAQVAKGILNGWSLDPILYARTGFPLDIQADSEFVNLADGTQFAARPDLIPGVPIWVRDSTVPGGRKINVAAFALPPLLPDGSEQFLTRQGSLGRNAITGPGMYQINLALRRQIKIGEKLDIQLAAEVFNIDNHPMFGNFNVSWFPGNFFFGKPQATLSNAMSDGSLATGALNTLYQLGGPRSVQLSARISF